MPYYEGSPPVPFQLNVVLVVPSYDRAFVDAFVLEVDDNPCAVDFVLLLRRIIVFFVHLSVSKSSKVKKCSGEGNMGESTLLFFVTENEDCLSSNGLSL